MHAGRVTAIEQEQEQNQSQTTTKEGWRRCVVAVAVAVENAMELLVLALKKEGAVQRTHKSVMK